MLGLNEIREKYLAFFESKAHVRMESAPLVPKNDPSLLLINSGMAPLKAFFTGAETPPSKRVTTCQKCIRTPDIDRVGKTARHGTFFEMLGNFSFGDYFKVEACTWAWEFVTKVVNLPVDRLWVSVYLEDDEAVEIWTKQVGVSPDRIVRLGKADNFWEHGTGPCGPCSEIYYDFGPEFGCGSPDCAVGCDCDRYIEFWNLVFTQFDKDEAGNYSRLANPNIDTGMGLERIAAICQGVSNLFEVDTVQNIIRHISKIAGVEYKKSEASDVSIRVITDHIRGTVFMVCDGVVPSNEGRGYVLRRLLRRAARHGKLLGIKGTFLHAVAETVIKESGEAYPELIAKREYITKIIKIEEDRFAETIDQGMAILEKFIESAKGFLEGDKIFKLYDTFGFPPDLTMEMLAEKGIAAQIEDFHKMMEEQRARARAARNEGSSWDSGTGHGFEGIAATKFVGYDKLQGNAEVLAVDSDKIVLDSTVFYGEKGGQVGDTGVIMTKNGSMAVKNCVAEGDLILHIGSIEGEIKVGEKVSLVVDGQRRAAIMRNHTATHLLQQALRSVLGEHVEQRGSLVQADRLRFDFTHFSGMTPEELRKVEDEVNEKILEGIAVETEEMSISKAREKGAMALFGEKYGEFVRVVGIGDYSTELCGGCHLTNTAKAGSFKITSEGGIAAGIRRIEAVTGLGVIKLIRDIEEQDAKELERIKGEARENAREAARKIEMLAMKEIKGIVSGLIETAEEKSGVRLVIGRIDDTGISGLRTACDEIKNRQKSVVAFACGVNDGKIAIVAAADKEAVEKGAHAGNLVREVSKLIGGSGGGKPDSGSGGGGEVVKLNDALGSVVEIIKGMLH